MRAHTYTNTHAHTRETPKHTYIRTHACTHARKHALGINSLNYNYVRIKKKYLPKNGTTPTSHMIEYILYSVYQRRNEL